MHSGTYSVRSLDTGATATVDLRGSRRGRMTRARIVAFIGAFQAEHGYAPPLREVAAAADLRSVGSVHLHVSLLVRSGHVEHAPGTCRSLRVVR